MKKVTILLSVFALVMGLSQCRKPSFSALNGGEPQYVVLSANNGNDGSKVGVNFAGIAMNLKWEENDKITVSGGLEGTLTLKSGAGEPTATFEGYATRGAGDVVVFTYGETPVFMGQTGTLDCVKGNIRLEGTSEYKDDGNYGVLMEVPYSVLKLDLRKLGTEDGADVSIKVGSDVVASVTGVKNGEAPKDLYVALPAYNEYGTPKDKLVEKSYKFESSVGSVSYRWPLVKNTFYTSSIGEAGSSIVVEPQLLSGKFSISATKYVQFSRGNLQFKAGDGSVASPEWRFAEHQYDHIINTPGNTTAAASRATQSAWIDLFGWGATGRTDINSNLAQPYESSQDNSKYKTIASVAANETLTRENGGDWGVCMGEGWCTLSFAEWQYLFGSSAERNGKYKYNVNVCGIARCLIIVPDVLDGYTFDKSKTSYTADEWATAEAAGLVCLPPSGWRGGSTVNVVYHGHYWSSSAHDSDTKYAFFMWFNEGGIDVENMYDNRYEGRSVRLVQRFPKPHDAVKIGDVYWATMNVGATTVAGDASTSYGDYFAWGEVEPYYASKTTSASDVTVNSWKSGKSSGYAWNSYCNNSSFVEWNPVPYDANNILIPKRDAANANWGGDWRMPTSEEFKKLYDACGGTGTPKDIATATVVDDKVTSKGIYWCGAAQTTLPAIKVSGLMYSDGNGNNLFFPAVGYFDVSGSHAASSYGYYWSGSFDSSNPDSAFTMAFYSDNVYPQLYGTRCTGRSIRPVHD